jgi:antitoxin component YwqK of YwqJK toxin-antitoxin module
MKNLIFLFLLSSTVLFSCKNPSSVVTIKDNINGIKVEYQFDTLKKVKQGFYKTFFENGNLASESHYLNDSMNGVEKFYYEDGSLNSVFTMKNGKSHGEFKYFYEDKTLKQEGTYVNNVLEGQLKTYYKNGKLKEIVTMVDSEEKGDFIEYYENGNLKAKGSYSGGPNSENCILEMYKEDSDGEFESKKYCKDGICCEFWNSEVGDVKPSSSRCEEIIKEMSLKCKK